MKKRLISLLLTLVMIAGALLLGGISVFAGTRVDKTKVVEVSTEEELRKALAARDGSHIVLTGDVKESFSRTYSNDPYAPDPIFDVYGNHVLDLNGYEIYFSCDSYYWDDADTPLSGHTLFYIAFTPAPSVPSITTILLAMVP